MSNDSKISRREMLKRSLTVVGVAAGSSFVLAGCKGEEEAPEALSCTDLTGVDPAAVQTRTAMGYQDNGPDATRHCTGCQFFTAGAAGQCGSCSLFAGPINPNGSCNSFAPKQA